VEWYGFDPWLVIKVYIKKYILKNYIWTIGHIFLQASNSILLLAVFSAAHYINRSVIFIYRPHGNLFLRCRPLQEQGLSIGQPDASREVLREHHRSQSLTSAGSTYQATHASHCHHCPLQCGDGLQGKEHHQFGGGAGEIKDRRWRR
jgi:hypothetical protein